MNFSTEIILDVLKSWNRSLCNRPSEIDIHWVSKRHWIGVFSTWFFFLVVERGARGRPQIFTATLNAFYILSSEKQTMN